MHTDLPLHQANFKCYAYYIFSSTIRKTGATKLVVEQYASFPYVVSIWTNIK